MTTSKKHKKVISFVLLITALTLFYPSLAATSEKPQRVFQVCGCRFPAEVGAFKNLDMISARYIRYLNISLQTLLWYGKSLRKETGKDTG